MLSANKSIEALIRLIDDPDENVFEHVRDELIGHGPAAIPLLETSWEEDNYGLLFQSRAENLIQTIQFKSILNGLQDWINSPHKDLLEGALLLSRYQYPNQDEQKVRSAIQEIRRDVWLEFNENQTAFEKVRLFNKIFYNKYNFVGNSKNFHSPLNSFINVVMESKQGNPLTLCVIYSIIAQSLDMPVYGVNLPNHFILAYMDEDNINPFINTDNIHGALFYINAFSKGSIFNEQEIKAFLKGLNKPATREHFEPCSNSAILIRMLTNLITSFQEAGSARKVQELTQLRDLFYS
jgi:regulator of sirC expression with transglutaminase-like and TPR domain